MDELSVLSISLSIASLGIFFLFFIKWWWWSRWR